MRYIALGLLVVALSSCGRAEPTDFEEVTFGAVRELSTPAGPGSGEPNLGAGPGGKVYLSWLEPRPDSGTVLKFAVLIGSQFSAPRTIAEAGPREWFVNWADFPSLLALDDKNLVAHWLARSGTGRYAYNVVVARTSDGGRTWSDPIIPHRDGTQSEHGFVSLIPMNRGTVGVLWLDGRKHATAKSEAEAEMTLRFTTLDARGVLGREREVDGRVCDCCQTAAALTSRGPIIVYRDRSADEIRDIAVTRYLNGHFTAPALVHADNWRIPACPVNGPAISARGKSVAVAWFTAANGVGRVKVAFSSDAGDTFGSPIVVDDGQPAGRVAVHELGDGGALVSWLERVGAGAELRVRHVRSDGRKSESKTITTTGAERASGFPRMLVRGQNVVFAWTLPGQPARVKAALLELKGS